MSRIEILVSTMNKKDINLYKEMNIKTDALIINQSNYFGYKEVIDNNNTIKMYTFNEKGVGKSRNNALIRSSAEICMLSDDDVKFEENYMEILEDNFDKYKNYDVLLFNVPSTNILRPTAYIDKIKKINKYNYMRYGAVNIAFRRNSIMRGNIYFSLLFGGGATYSAGEDTLFLKECLSKGLKILAVPQKVAVVKQEESTWFKKYDEKYFYDKGVFFYHLGQLNPYLLILQFIIRKRKLYKKDKITMLEAFQYSLKGIKDFKKKG